MTAHVWRQRLKVGLWTLATILLGTFSADLVRDGLGILSASVRHPLWTPATSSPWILIPAGLVMGLATAVPAMRAVRGIRRLTRSQAVVRRTRHPGRSVLIIGLSPLGRRPDQPDFMAMAKDRHTQIEAIANEAKKREARRLWLDELCDPNGLYKGFQWQQPLRAARKLGEDLKLLGVLLSTVAAKHRDDFRWLVEALMPDLRTVMTGRPVDIEDYNEVAAELDELVTRSLSAIGGTTADLCIDITGASKPYTAVATVKTLNNDAIFSYVGTFGDYAGEVTTYDATIT